MVNSRKFNRHISTKIEKYKFKVEINGIFKFAGINQQ